MTVASPFQWIDDPDEPTPYGGAYQMHQPGALAPTIRPRHGALTEGPVPVTAISAQLRQLVPLRTFPVKLGTLTMRVLVWILLAVCATAPVSAQSKGEICPQIAISDAVRMAEASRLTVDAVLVLMPPDIRATAQAGTFDEENVRARAIKVLPPEIASETIEAMVTGAKALPHLIETAERFEALAEAFKACNTKNVSLER